MSSKFLASAAVVFAGLALSACAHENGSDHRQMAMKGCAHMHQAQSAHAGGARDHAGEKSGATAHDRAEGKGEMRGCAMMAGKEAPRAAAKPSDESGKDEHAEHHP